METLHKMLKSCLLKLVKTMDFVNKENCLTAKCLHILGTLHSLFDVSDTSHGR